MAQPPRKPGESDSTKKKSGHVSTNETLVTICMPEQMCAGLFYKRSAGHYLEKKPTFFGHWVFDGNPLCHYGTQTITIKTPPPTLPLGGLKKKCQNPKAERDHNNILSTGSGSIMGLKTGESDLWLQHSFKSTHSCRV